MRERVTEVIKYGFWGVVSTGINLLLFYLMVLIKIPYIISNVVSYIIAVAASYVFNNKFVFKNSSGNEAVKQLKYGVMRVASIAVDSGILAFLHEVLGFDLMVSKIIDSIIIVLSTYILSKLWVFKKTKATAKK